MAHVKTTKVQISLQMYTVLLWKGENDRRKYGHSLPSADSRRAVVSFWRKNVHNTDQPHRGLSLPSKCVVK